MKQNTAFDGRLAAGARGRHSVFLSLDFGSHSDHRNALPAGRGLFGT